MNINITFTIWVLSSIIFYGLLLYALLKLKKHVQAAGTDMMLFSMLAMIVSGIVFAFIPIDTEARWFVFLESTVGSLTLLVFCIGFYRFSKWAIDQENNLNNHKK